MQQEETAFQACKRMRQRHVRMANTIEHENLRGGRSADF